jgi:hypothetical protein
MVKDLEAGRDRVKALCEKAEQARRKFEDTEGASDAMRLRERMLDALESALAEANAFLLDESRKESLARAIKYMVYFDIETLVKLVKYVAV